MLSAAVAVLLAMQAQTSTASDEILVTGQRLSPESARRYVNQITRPIDGQLPTFRNPVCPAVIGLPAEQGGIVVERVRKVAKHVKMPVAPAGCAANLRVIVVEDAQTFVSELKRQKPEFFGGMDIRDIERLLADQRPALAWISTQVQNEDGQVFADNASGRSSFDRTPKNRVSSADPNGEDALGSAEDMGRAGSGASGMRTKSASIIKSTTQQAIVDSYVVIDTAAAKGKSLMQLADYVTMRALGGAQPPASDVAVETILTLFEDGSKPHPASVRRMSPI